MSKLFPVRVLELVHLRKKKKKKKKKNNNKKQACPVPLKRHALKYNADEIIMDLNIRI